MIKICSFLDGSPSIWDEDYADCITAECLTLSHLAMNIVDMILKYIRWLGSSS